jgi:hypothetical protein
MITSQNMFILERFMTLQDTTSFIFETFAEQRFDLDLNMQQTLISYH